jgi:hypothetical protein
MQSFKEFIGEGKTKDFALEWDVDSFGKMLFYRNKLKFGDVINNMAANDLSLRSLEGCPTVVRDSFNVSDNMLKMNGLKGGPIDVGFYTCRKCELTSLEGAPERCGTFNATYNHISSLEGIGKKYLKECEILLLSINPLESNFLGLLKVQKLTMFNIKGNELAEPWRAAKIIDAHIQGDKDVMEAHEELTRAGLKQYAKF